MPASAAAAARPRAAGQPAAAARADAHQPPPVARRARSCRSGWGSAGRRTGRAAPPRSRACRARRARRSRRRSVNAPEASRSPTHRFRTAPARRNPSRVQGAGRSRCWAATHPAEPPRAPGPRSSAGNTRRRDRRTRESSPPAAHSRQSRLCPWRRGRPRR